ncbi:MAG: replicative DNA helicase [Rickettsiales bacterium]|jgi:replicative DNA helicase|nr:replicative DNA helicase [Rickettsiales bacterium]
MQNNSDFRGLYNIEAEQIILGKVIANNDYYGKISEYLQEDCFYELAHRELYSYLAKVIQKSTIVADSVTLKNFFDDNEILKVVGGSNYLSILLSTSSGIVDIVSYAKLIQDLAIRRKLAIIGEEIVSTVHANDAHVDSARDQIELAEKKLFDLSNKIEYNRGFLGMADSLAETIQNIKLAKQRDSHISGISSGFMDLDRMLSGFQKSDLIILAGRPSMGKTTLAINVAYNVAQEFREEAETSGSPRKSVGFFSLEMPVSQISAKILSLETGLNTDKFRKGDINEREFGRIVEKSDKISKAPLFIDDTPALTISSIRTRVRRLMKQENAGFVVVDYLQLIRGVNDSSRNNRVLEISEITQGLKAIAKEFNIPLMALSQLSRLVEQREDKKPQLSDLRESGSIEQDADIVMFVFRESYYEERKKPSTDQTEKLKQWQINMEQLRNKSEVIIAKHRNGPIGNIELYYSAESSKFADYMK